MVMEMGMEVEMGMVIEMEMEMVMEMVMGDGGGESPKLYSPANIIIASRRFESHGLPICGLQILSTDNVTRNITCHSTTNASPTSK